LDAANLLTVPLPVYVNDRKFLATFLKIDLVKSSFESLATRHGSMLVIPHCYAVLAQYNSLVSSNSNQEARVIGVFLAVCKTLNVKISSESKALLGVSPKSLVKKISDNVLVVCKVLLESLKQPDTPIVLKRTAKSSKNPKLFDKLKEPLFAEDKTPNTVANVQKTEPLHVDKITGTPTLTAKQIEIGKSKEPKSVTKRLSKKLVSKRLFTGINLMVAVFDLDAAAF
jgi:hypothetical protein